MFRTFLSWRYLISRKTNLIGMCGIGVGVFVLIVILSIMTGFLEENKEAVRDGLAEVTLKPWPSEGARPDSQALLEVLEADARIRGAAVQLATTGMLTQDRRSALGQVFQRPEFNTGLFVELLGVDPGAPTRLESASGDAASGSSSLRGSGEFGVTEFYEALTGTTGRPFLMGPSQPVLDPLEPFVPPDRLFLKDVQLPGIVLGDDLAAQLRIRAGEVVKLSTVILKQRLGRSTSVTKEFVVAGTFRSGHATQDRGRIYMDRRVLTALLQDSQSYNRIVLKLHDYEADIDALLPDLRGRLEAEGLIVAGHGAEQVESWENIRGGMLAAIENERVMMGVMLSLILMVAGFTIFAILSMMVTEKRRDIGILLSLGATPRGILQVFLLVAVWDALVGALFGGALGVWTALNITALEQGLADNFGIEIFNRDVFLFQHIPSVVEPLPVTLILIWTFLCVLAFSAFPAWRAARMAPLDALRYE